MMESVWLELCIKLMARWNMAKGSVEEENFLFLFVICFICTKNFLRDRRLWSVSSCWSVDKSNFPFIRARRIILLVKIFVVGVYRFDVRWKALETIKSRERKKKIRPNSIVNCLHSHLINKSPKLARVYAQTVFSFVNKA